MKRILTIIVITAALAGLSACGEKAPPQPEEIMGRKLLTALRGLSHAYEKRDLNAFMALTLPAAEERGSWESGIKEVFTKYDAVRFSFQNTKMLVTVPDRGNIRVAVNWDAEWSGGGALVKDGGRATLVFEPKSMLLAGIEGKNPFIPAVTPMKQQ